MAELIFKTPHLRFRIYKKNCTYCRLTLTNQMVIVEIYRPKYFLSFTANRSHGLEWSVLGLQDKIPALVPGGRQHYNTFRQSRFTGAELARCPVT